MDTDMPVINPTLTAMQEANVATEEPVYVDYFGFDERQRITLPDGKQWLEIKTLNEGERSRFQKLTNRDVTLQRTTGDARMRLDPAEERHQLIEQAVTGWSIMKRDPNKGDFYPVPFNRNELKTFLEFAPPHIVNLIEKEIRKLNPWLMAEMSLEDIDREIKDLQELRETKVKEEQGN